MLEVMYFRKLHDIQICQSQAKFEGDNSQENPLRKQKKTPTTTQKFPNKFRDYKKESLAKQNL